jgi:two-component system invasion response regulator UvrY
MIKVLVADDHDLVRTGIVRMLEDADTIDVIAEAANGEEALRLCKQHNPDIVLMDIRMPGIGGMAATKKIVSYNADIKVIALTAHAEDPFPAKLLQAGAMGFITKGASPEQMIDAILKVQSGNRYISPEVAQDMALKPFAPAQEENPLAQLSERELQIALKIVACEKVAQIAEDLNITTKTVNSYRYRMFEKLGIQSDVELALMAVRHGLIDNGPQ